MYARTLIQDLSTSNKIYSNAIITIYEVSAGMITDTLATLYSGLTGSGTLQNPQTLDAYGKFRQPVYIDGDVIMKVTGLGNTPDHDTGIIKAGLVISGTGSPEGSVSASVGTMYLRLDGGTDTTLYIKESGSSSTGWVAK